MGNDEEGSSKNEANGKYVFSGKRNLISLGRKGAIDTGFGSLYCSSAAESCVLGGRLW